MNNLTKEEWLEVCSKLEGHHAVFYKIWEMGKPIFSDTVPTAAVQFDQGGDFVLFHFNPEYWEKSTPYERLFTICHEALHVILNHGIRSRDTVDSRACNVALDIVVNHMLTRCFGFDRKRIRNWEELCWVDTVFKNKDGTIKKDVVGRPIPTDESFEYYINQFEKINAGMSDKGNSKSTLDDHSKLGEGNFGEAVDKLDKGLSDEEKKDLEKIIDKHFTRSKEETRAGTGTGGQWHFCKGESKRKKKWETVIKKWSSKYLKMSDKSHEQWARLNRRFQFLPSKLFLPSEMEIEEREKEKTRIQVYFFLDTSGSCWGLKDRFFTAAESLPKERFDIRLFCFDTMIKETTLASKKVYGGGGTAFDIIEAYIQKEVKEHPEVGYPKAVFIITDGYGNTVKPEKPEKWYWFLSTNQPIAWENKADNNKNPYKKVSVNPICGYAPKECNFYSLKDYE